MTHAGPILVPVDFSPDSVSALEWAVRVAPFFAASVVVVHVVHDPYASPGVYSEEQERVSGARIHEAASKMTADFAARMRETHPGISEFAKLETRVVSGLPATRIIEVAEQLDAQLIVMGSRGRTGLDHLLLGSTAERVIQRSPIPVTIAKAAPGAATER